MPRTLDEGFRAFIYKLTPSSTESIAASRHRRSIESCLKNNFGMQRFFRTGSFGNGTSISGYSDVDYFASIPTKNLKNNSSATLRQVREALENTFPKTGVRVTCPSVLVPFGNEAKEATEIVPADYLANTSKKHKVKIYDIPDCEGGWMKSSPDAHNAYVRRVDKKFSGKVKSLIRLLKAWKYYRNVPISSFYLELRATKYSEGESSILYDIDLKRILSHLHSNGLPMMQDPLGISGYVSPCASTTQHEDAMSKLSTALSRAQKAVAAKQNNDIKNAFYWWNLFFAEKFPSYYR